MPAEEAPADALEIDELCLRQSPPLWVWVIVSRQVGQVLGFMFGDRTDLMLKDAWSDVPADWQERSVFTDGWGAYARFFPSGQHTVCEKGSGGTSHAEGWNTKWRQRQSGLTRKSCGVCHGIIDDLYERFLILVAEHNQHQKRRWNQVKNATRSNP